MKSRTRSYPLPIALLLLASVVGCQTTQSGVNRSQVSESAQATNLAALAQKSPAVTLVQMGSPLNPSPCQGFSLTWARLSKTVALSACKGEKQVEKDVQLNSDQVNRMVNLSFCRKVDTELSMV
jgi:hypothetical protein